MGATETPPGPDGAFGASQPDLLLAAAREIVGLTQPLSDRVEQIERKQSIRERYGMDSPEDQLLAAIDVRALLQEPAREFG